jgi:hypothetical protein
LPDSEPVRQIKRTLNWLVAATVVLFVATGCVAYLGLHSSQKTNRSLCALRGDLEKRVAQSQDFLVQHPEGFAGIPAATIRQGLVNQEHTIKALSGLSC